MERELKFRAVITFDIEGKELNVMIPNVSIYANCDGECGISLDGFEAALKPHSIIYHGDNEFTLNGNAIDAKFNTYDGDDWIAFDAPIMQFTGMKDCNGIAIYEGDIIKIQATKHHLTYIGVVVYDQSGCCFEIDIKNDNKRNDWMPIETKNEVIGNVYENPELLK